MAARAFTEQDQLVAALGDGLEEGQQASRRREPGRDRHLDRQRPGHRPDDEARRDDHHVDDDHMLEGEGIGDLGDEVDRR